ncbi:MAG: SynChlorMet cassette radical SAM/SPASM protein ScmF [Pseudomonadota bacterium]
MGDHVMDGCDAIESTNVEYPLGRLYFYVTGGCNLRCRHCWIEPQYQGEGKSFPFLDVDLFASIIAQAKPLGLLGIKLTGGEPLIHPHILEILRIVQERKLELVVETNGTACTREISEHIAACGNAFVSVSLDGVDPAVHEWIRGVKGSRRAALEGIRNLVEAGISPQIIMTVMRRNVGEMEALIRSAETLGAGSVKFNLLQPIARGEDMHRAGEALPIDELIELGRWVETVLAPGAGLPIFFDHPPAFSPLSRMFGREGKGCDRCGILGILGVLADGSYALCGIGESEPDLVFGNAQDTRLKDVWTRSGVLRDIREGMPHRLDGICRRCLMKRMCLGACTAQNYHRSKSLWGPYWYCEEAWKRGLFPETREISKA